MRSVVFGVARFAVAVAVAIALSSCGGSTAGGETGSADGGSVLVTTSIWADIVENVGCSEVGPLEPLIPPGADPHGYRPSIADAEATMAASMIVANGGGLEESLEPLLDQAEDEGVSVLYLTDELAGGDDDPHLWLDPAVTVEAVKVVERALVSAGFDAGTVGECSDNYTEDLLDLDADLAAEVERLSADRRKLVTNHDALDRFAGRYGFDVIGTVLPSTSTLAQANPSELEDLGDLIGATGLPAIFTEGGHHGEDAHALADRLEINVVELQTDALGSPDSGFGTYVELMKTNTELIVDALAETGDHDDDDDDQALLGALTDPADWWVAPFTGSSVMRRALLAGLLVVFTTSIVGTWVVLRGMSFLGDALAHGVLPGVAVAFIIGLSTTLGALAAALLMVGMLTVLRERSPMAEDVSIGILFVGFLASAVVILSSGSDQYVGDLNRFLFGSVLAVGDGDLVRQGVAALVVVAAAAVFHRAFLCLTFDRQLAELLGLRPRVAHGVLLVLVMVAIVSSFEAVGNLLVFAFLVAPPATAALLVKRVPVIMAAATGLGAVAVVIGLLVAYHYRTAAEATMALIAVVIFLGAAALKGRSTPGVAYST